MQKINTTYTNLESDVAFYNAISTSFKNITIQSVKHCNQILKKEESKFNTNISNSNILNKKAYISLGKISTVGTEDIDLEKITTHLFHILIITRYNNRDSTFIQIEGDKCYFNQQFSIDNFIKHVFRQNNLVLVDNKNNLVLVDNNNSYGISKFCRSALKFIFGN